MKLQPLGDRLIVRAIEDQDETTLTGIVSPDTGEEKLHKGRVLVVGGGALDDDGKRVPLDISEGDDVLYSKYGGTEIKIDGEDLLVLHGSDVLGTLDQRRGEVDIAEPDDDTPERLAELRQGVRADIAQLRDLAK